MARVTHFAGGGYQVTVTSAEFALVRKALGEARRLCRFGIEILDGADEATQAETAKTSRLRQEIEALAMREASLRSLQKTMAEIDNR